jgi:hypothetical protein
VTGNPQVPSDIGLDFVPHPRREIVSVEIDGELIVYDDEREMAHLLSPTAAIVWELLDGRSRVDEIAADIAEAFDLTTDNALDDVITLVQDLASRGLLEDGSSPTASTTSTSQL